MKTGQKLYIVDMETVSIFNEDALLKIAQNEKTYKETPFLFLVMSYVRNQSVMWADKNLKYVDKRQNGSWMVYCFIKN